MDTGQMGRVPGTDRTHTRGCPAKILYVYWFFSFPNKLFELGVCNCALQNRIFRESVIRRSAKPLICGDADPINRLNRDASWRSLPTVNRAGKQGDGTKRETRRHDRPFPFPSYTFFRHLPSTPPSTPLPLHPPPSTLHPPPRPATAKSPAMRQHSSDLWTDAPLHTISQLLNLSQFLSLSQSLSFSQSLLQSLSVGRTRCIRSTFWRSGLKNISEIFLFRVAQEPHQNQQLELS